MVAVASKLAGIPHRIWIDGSDFKVGFGAKGDAEAETGAVSRCAN
jgi:hypothetical protein